MFSYPIKQLNNVYNKVIMSRHLDYSLDVCTAKLCI